MKWLERALWLGKQRGLSQNAVARLFGGGDSVIPKWKKGGEPKIEQILKIAEGLGVSLDYLFQEDMPWLDDAEKMGVGPAVDKDADALLRLLAALDISPAEAMRRVVASEEGSRIVAVQSGKHRIPGPSGDSGGEPLPAGRPDGPSGKRAGVKRSRADKDLN